MIYPEIRAIAMGFEGIRKLILIFYLEREPNEDDYENVSDVAVEVLADIEFSEVEEKCVFSTDILLNLNSLDCWVYMRKEKVV
ncbi:hypothetical protein [uncultured Flavobacterium sp.]|uniref:hypothetical protein n=1 Tax=uncultured Flavobacterium sp. TaxID=165435 RepID=UPI003081FB1D